MTGTGACGGRGAILGPRDRGLEKMLRPARSPFLLSDVSRTAPPEVPALLTRCHSRRAACHCYDPSFPPKRSDPGQGPPPPGLWLGAPGRVWQVCWGESLRAPPGSGFVLPCASWLRGRRRRDRPEGRCPQGLPARSSGAHGHRQVSAWARAGAGAPRGPAEGTRGHRRREGRRRRCGGTRQPVALLLAEAPGAWVGISCVFIVTDLQLLTESSVPGIAGWAPDSRAVGTSCHAAAETPGDFPLCRGCHRRLEGGFPLIAPSKCQARSGPLLARAVSSLVMSEAEETFWWPRGFRGHWFSREPCTSYFV